MKLRALLILGAVGLSTLAAGCGATRDKEVSVASQGLSVVSMDEAAGKLTLVFRKDGRSISYDLRLGSYMEVPPTLEELAANPDLPVHEIDAQVTDAAGRVMYQQMGGDSFLDPSWRMPHIENIDEAGRVADFKLMREAVDAFRALSLPAALADLGKTGIQLGLTIDNLAEKADKAAVVTPPTAPIDGEGTLSPKVTLADSNNTSVVKWDYRIRNKNLAGGIGNHTAVHLRGWSSGGSILYNATSCNHGSCANYSDMSTHCVMTGFKSDDGTHTRFFYSDTTTSTGSQNGGCTTHYDWDSSAALNGGAHNCNDDSELQRNAIWSDSSQCTTCGSCSSTGFHNWSPDCN